MTITTTNKDLAIGLTHGIIIPFLMVIIFQSQLGFLYLLIPFFAYLTFASHKKHSKDVFTICMICILIILITSWADEPLIEASLSINGGM